MPNITEIQAQMEQTRSLLRDGRVTEADKVLDALQVSIVEQLAAEKAAAPPPSPLTTEQLTMAAFDEIAAKLGNAAKLDAILVELRAKLIPAA